MTVSELIELLSNVKDQDKKIKLEISLNHGNEGHINVETDFDLSVYELYSHVYIRGANWK